MLDLQCTVYLIRRDMIEALTFVFLRQTLPVQFGRLQHGERTHHIGAGEGERVLDRAVYMTLCGEVNDARHFLLLHQRIDRVEIAYIRLHKAVVGFILDIFEVRQISGIRQLIHIDNAVVGILIYE